MTTALAAQLAQLAASSKSTLDVKAQKAAHAKSLIFEPRNATSQSFQTIFRICREGFEELCQLDGRFAPFGSTLFSEQSQEEDRGQMTAAENAELDKRIDSFLRLVGGRLRLMPAIKAVEWLIRRFRIHEFNTTILITTFLPYHTIPAFVTLLSILPQEIPHEYRFLTPYIRSLTPPPRTVLVHHAIHHPESLATLSAYTLESCENQQHHPALISFWAGMMTEAVNGMLEKMRSGRRTVQQDNDQALLHQFGPTMAKGLVMKKAPDMQIASYMVTAVFVSKGNFDDGVVTALMEQLVSGWTSETLRPGLVCLAIAAQYRSRKHLPRTITKAFLKVQNLPDILADIGKEHRVDKLANGLCLSLLTRLGRKGNCQGLSVVEHVLNGHLLRDNQLRSAFRSLLLTAHKIDDRLDERGEARKALASTIMRLSQAEGRPGEVFAEAIMSTEVDIEALEMRLEANFRPKSVTGQPREDENPGENSDSSAAAESFESAIQKVSDLRPSPTSCLQLPPSDAFTQLCSVFLSALSDPAHLAAFTSLPALQHNQALDNPFYITFFIRIWCGPYPTLARVGALNVVKDRLNAVDHDPAKLDLGGLLAHSIAALSDPSKKVRRAAADLLILLESLQHLNAGHGQDRMPSRLASIYDNSSEQVASIGGDVMHTLLSVVLTPTLEECVLNSDHIHALIQTTVNGGSKTAAERTDNLGFGHLPHRTRSSLLSFLSRHVVSTPLLLVKLRLLDSLNGIKSVSSVSPAALLQPLLRWWTSLAAEDAARLCAQESVDESVVDQKIVGIVVPSDKPNLNYLLDAVRNPGFSTRHNLTREVFSRISKLWPKMRSELKHDVAEKMLEMAQADNSLVNSAASEEAADFLKNVELSTGILMSFLGSLQTNAKVATATPPAKRRRISSSEGHRGVGGQPSEELSHALSNVTFVLQLVEGSDPGRHPQLLNALFDSLSALQHFRVLVGSELGYLQNLILRSLLAMVPAFKSNEALQIDSSGGYGDLLVNCIQKSSSPAVQSSALLLVAGLARVAPELVLHSVMPIFTFMETSVLRQSDDYSAHVIHETIKEVVPPLIESLRKGKKGTVAGASELLLSFVTAYEHIPSYRRLGLFVLLVETLGAGEFLFALLAMLIDRYGSADRVYSFAGEVFSYFDVEIELQSLAKLVDLNRDVFQPRPGISTVLLGTHEEEGHDPERIALRQLRLLSYLLSNRKLSLQINKLSEHDDMEAARVRELYSTLLEMLLSLTESLKMYKTLHSRCGDGLGKLLNLLPVEELIKAVESLLGCPDNVLRRKVLRAVEVRIDQESQANSASTLTLLAFLPQLTAIVRDSEDVSYKHIAVGCVGKIAEKYGKKDPEAVIAAASIIAGDRCLGQVDTRLRIMALLCLASLIGVLQDGFVPILPASIPKSLSYMSESIETESPSIDLHNAAYAFMTALSQHLPYMLSGAYLQRLLAVSNVSAKANFNTEANDARSQCLQFVAKQVDAKVMFPALERNWDHARDSGFMALREYINILGMAVDKHSKANVAKNVSPLSTMILGAFDLRRLEFAKGNVPGSTTKNISKIEDAACTVALGMIYKLNDASFRPIFSQLMEWAASSLPKTDTTGKNLRLLSVFGFLSSFFENLKSIVTNYASYIIDSAVGVLNATKPSVPHERELWRKVLHTLTKCFEHDQDDFWQAPAHFGAVAPALVAQFGHAASVDPTQDLVPAIVELAAAADSQEHQRELNRGLLQWLRAESAPVRLAAVRCQQALTKRLREEWLDMLPQMLPYISELQEDDDDEVERETHRWIVGVEGVLGERLDAMLQ